MLLALRNLPITTGVLLGQDVLSLDEESAGPPRKAARTDSSDDISDSRKDTIQQDEEEEVICRELLIVNPQGVFLSDLTSFSRHLLLRY